MRVGAVMLGKLFVEAALQQQRRDPTAWTVVIYRYFCLLEYRYWADKGCSCENWERCSREI